MSAHGQAVLASTALAAVFALMSTGTFAVTEDWTAAWPDAAALRPSPALTRPVLMNCDGDSSLCKRAAWLAFLKSRNLDELQAPSGGRAYRWLWEGPMFVNGYVQLVVHRDGAGEMISSRNARHVSVSAENVARFERALAQSEFAHATQDGEICLDECQDQLLEAVVNGRYHYVERDGGVDEKDGRGAALILEQLAGFSPPTKDFIDRASTIEGGRP